MTEILSMNRAAHREPPPAARVLIVGATSAIADEVARRYAARARA